MIFLIYPRCIAEHHAPVSQHFRGGFGWHNNLKIYGHGLIKFRSVVHQPTYRISVIIVGKVLIHSGLLIVKTALINPRLRADSI